MRKRTPRAKRLSYYDKKRETIVQNCDNLVTIEEYQLYEEASKNFVERVNGASIAHYFEDCLRMPSAEPPTFAS